MSKKNKQQQQHTPTQIKAPTEINGVTEVGVVSPTTPVKAFEQHNQLYGGRSPIVEARLATVHNYIAYMSPGVQVSEEDGVRWQMRLFETILAICNFENVSDMVAGMDALMELFYEEREGALNGEYTQRFTDKLMVTDESQRDLYMYLCYVLAVFSNPVLRLRLGYNIQLTGDGNILEAMDPEPRTRLVNYLMRLLEDTPNPAAQ